MGMKLGELETAAKKNEALLNKIQRDLYSKLNNPSVHTPRPVVASTRSWVTLDSTIDLTGSRLNLSTPAEHAVCQDNTVSLAKRANTDVQMLDVYNLLEFDNPDGGVWKQGWGVTYDKQKVENEEPKLQVFVVPHSHTDPGWVKTFEAYYTQQTSHILSNTLTMLNDYPAIKFIYAEMSFFELWFRGLSDTERAALRKALINGQLEIVTGAWVQTDEANSHYFSIIDQMIEGHQWLVNHLGYMPKNHWSIDPFGLSPTMAHLLKLSGIEQLVIQRVHYAVKKFLASSKDLEFYWRQLWSNDARGDVFTHLLPFYSYDIPHTCGPDPKVCCQFDFTRMRGGLFSCPWGAPAQRITKENVAERAATLLDQYRKHAQLYKTNVLLVPLGDDFRYTSADEWHKQYDNYKELFEYMNQQKEWNVQAQFGTLEDYFSASRNALNASKQGVNTLSGDFFTYADRNQDYWSGYYTSRPFYKRMERVLANYLRGAEILYNFMIARMDGASLKFAAYPAADLFPRLVTSRRNLGLFQHHDGVAGTAKTFVMKDYGQRMSDSIEECKRVIATSAFFAMNNAPPLPEDANPVKLNFDDAVMSSDVVFEQKVISVQPYGLRTLVLYNSLSYGRSEVVCIRTDTADVELYDKESRLVPMQISPLVKRTPDGFLASVSVFEVCWLAFVDSLALVTYELKKAAMHPDSLSTIYGRSPINLGFFPVRQWPHKDFTINGSSYTATFSTASGLLKALASGRDRPIKVEIEIVAYSTVDRKFIGSGAYLFAPSEPAKNIGKTGSALIVNGPIYSSVYVGFAEVLHEVRIVKPDTSAGQSVLVRNTVDITTQEEDYELAMRIVSGIDNQDGEFFSDLNGMQLIKRKHFKKLPIQGNFYPMPSAAFIEDAVHRITLLSGQPGGVASLQRGQLEVLMDRRTHLDDNRGVGQPMLDNIVFTNRFSILLEKSSGAKKAENTTRMGYLSMVAFHQSMALLYPMFQMFSADGTDLDFRGSTELSPAKFPCDYHLVNLRSVEGAASPASHAEVEPHLHQSLLILHRSPVTCGFTMRSTMRCVGRSSVTAASIFGDRVKSIQETSLTMMRNRKSMTLVEPLLLNVMDVKAYRLIWL